MDLDDEIDAAGRERATVMMLKLLFGAIERLDPVFAPEHCKASIAEALTLVMPDDGSEITGRMKTAALDFVDRVMGSSPS